MSRRASLIRVGIIDAALFIGRHVQLSRAPVRGHRRTPGNVLDGGTEMRQLHRWSIMPVILAVALSFTTAGAADKTKVDAATKQVEQGAKQIGQGQVGKGAKETAKGIGNTVVEGAKFSGNTIKEFFKKHFGS